MHPTPPPSLPEPVLRTFFFIRKALHRQRHDAVRAMALKYTRLHPAYAGYYMEMDALALKEGGHRDAALERLREANTFFKGGNPSVLRHVCASLREAQKFDEALALIREGMVTHPDHGGLRQEFWHIRFDQGHMAEALHGLRQLCQDKPDADNYRLLGECAFELGHHEESMAAFEKVHELNPLAWAVWNNHIFLAHYVPGMDAAALRALLTRAHDMLTKRLPPTPPEALHRDRGTTRPLRVGLLSAGLRLHPVGWMAARTLRLLSRLGNYEFYIYDISSSPATTGDPLRQIFCESAAQWLEVGHWPDATLYTRMLEDTLDIMLDMAGHADGGRPHFFVQRVAPVQIKWVGGLFNTSGIANMDYLLSDIYETPPGVDSDYAEKIIRLPHSYVSYTPPDYGHGVRPVPRLTHMNNGRVCFGCFNNAHKINHALVAVWARILHRVPDSMMYIKDGKLDREEAQQRIATLFAAHGIDRERLRLEGRAAQSDLLTCYNRVDIALDTWPYTGGLTTLEALWMGVPVITTPGPTFAGRHALSHLSNAGLEEFITPDFAAYEALAVELAGHPEVLDNLRLLLRLRVLQSPLVDHPQRAADLDTALRAAWQRHSEGLAPIAMRFDAPTAITDAMRQAWCMPESRPERYPRHARCSKRANKT